MRQCDDFVIFDACQSFGRDHCVDNGFLGSLHRSSEEQLNFFVGQHFQIHDVICKRDVGVGGGKSDKNVAGTVAGNTSIASEAQSDAASQALQLMGQQWRVGGDHHDDGTTIS